MTFSHLAMLAVGAAAGLWAAWRVFLHVRLAAFEERDTCVHEVGHALLFAPWLDRVDPKVRVEMDSANHELPTELVMAPLNRPWLMLVCLAGRAAEIVAGRNGGLLKDGTYVSMLDQLSDEDGDGRRWVRLAVEELQLGESATTRQGKRLLDARRRADMDALIAFFRVNRALLVSTAERLLQERGLEPSVTAPLLRQVAFTSKVSPALVSAVPAGNCESTN